MKTVKLFLLFIPLFLFGQEKLTYPDLVKRLYDMEYLATPPDDGEQSGAFSSFDRSSTYNLKTLSERWHDDAMVVGHLPFMVSHLATGSADLYTVSFEPGSVVSLDKDAQ